MKKFILKTISFLTFLIFCNGYYSQVPNGYYDGTEDLRNEELREALFHIIKDHTSMSYSSLWTIFYDTDQKPNGKVWDMYSDNPGGTPPYEYTFGEDQCGNYGGEAYCYNREHSFPKSWFNDESPMYTDLFHLYPTDGYVNGMRSNYPYGKVGSANWTSRNGSKRGTSGYPGYSGIVFEPIDEYKGDFARTYFYMLTCYMNKISQWQSDMLSENSFSEWARNMLLEWHRNDPVSEKEINRNNAVYSYQNNRNPFIDHPRFADKIWDPDYIVEPVLTIVSPDEDITVNVNEIEFIFTVSDFNLGTEGKVEFKLNDNIVLYSIESPVIIPSLTNGTNLIELKLVDMDNNYINDDEPQTRTITYQSETYISSFSYDNIIEVFPNPSNNFITININDKNITEADIYITDIAGKLILIQENLNLNNPVNITDKENGIYFLSVKLKSGEIFSQKFVIIK